MGNYAMPTITKTTPPKMQGHSLGQGSDPEAEAESDAHGQAAYRLSREAGECKGKAALVYYAARALWGHYNRDRCLLTRYRTFADWALWVVARRHKYEGEPVGYLVQVGCDAAYAAWQARQDTGSEAVQDEAARDSSVPAIDWVGDCDVDRLLAEDNAALLAASDEWGANPDTGDRAVWAEAVRAIDWVGDHWDEITRMAGDDRD